jgi:hypothetical protein
LSGLEDSLLGRDVLGEHCCALGGQSVWASTIFGFEGNNQSSAFEAREYLIEGAGRQMDARELLDILHEGVAVFVTSRETGKDEHGGPRVAPEAH